MRLKFFSLLTLLFILSGVAHASSDPYEFKKALALYKKLKSPKVKNKESFASTVIQRFYRVYTRVRSRKFKAFSMFMIGKTYLYLLSQERNGNEVFADLTISSFYRVVREFPESSLCDDAKYYIAYVLFYYKNVPERALRELYSIFSNYPSGDYRARAKKLVKVIFRKHPELKKNFKITKHYYRSTLKRIRDFVSKNFFRVVFDLNKIPKYEVVRGEFEVKVVLFHTKLSPSFKILNLNNQDFDKKIFIDRENSNLVISISTDTILSLKHFVLTNPQRVVLDVEFEKVSLKKPHERIETIVIDPGHGGKDPGALYYGLPEKVVTLKIAKLLKRELLKRLPRGRYRIYLTRTDDRYIYLEDRVKFANNINADLFISIHCNASKNRNLKGFQTFYINMAKDRVKISSSDEVQAIIDDLVRMAKFSESYRFASIVHRNILSFMRARYSRIEDHGVKKAPFYVLAGTKMPSILLEISFISNPMENRRLRNRRYLRNVSVAIANGVIEYISKAKFTKK